MKKVCHITSAHPRHDGRILRKQCVTLSNNGYDVTLLVNDDEGNAVFDKVSIISAGFSPRNRFDRLLNSRKRIIKKAREIKADVYQLHDPDLLLLVNRLRKTGAKVIFDSHENYPDQINSKSYLPSFLSRIISKIFILIERSAFKKCDGLITVNSSISQRIKPMNENTVIITNYPIQYNTVINYGDKQQKICFAGGIEPKYNHENILKAIESIDIVEYELAGFISKNYSTILESYDGYKKTNFHGLLSFDKVQNIYKESLIGLAIHYSDRIAKLNGGIGCTKLFEFMEAGLAIVCSNYSIWKQIIEENNCGIVVDPGNVDEIREAIKYLLDNKETAIEMGRNGHNAFIKKYNWDTQAVTLLDFYNNLF
jgi:glycosyltransferase involved in cell wall biosynthesis